MLSRLNRRIARPQQQGGDEEHATGDNSYSAQRPREAEAVDERLCRETEQHTAHPRPGSRDARGDGPPRVEPLREDGDGGDVGEADCEAEEEALGEVQVPGLGGEGGEEERGCLEEGAEEDEEAGAGEAG